MAEPDERSQLNYDVSRVFHQGARVGWDVAATNVIELLEPVGTPERTAKIAFVADFAGKIATKPNELVLFHSAGPDFAQFHALVPDPERPLELVVASKEGQKPFMYVNYLSKSGFMSIAGARDITFSESNDLNPPITIYMGPGVQSKTVSPDLFFDTQTEAKHVAVGNIEISQLFDTLRRENDPVYNNRLFGALFHVALLADDFGISIPAVPGLTKEATKALKTIDAETSVSEVTITLAREANTMLANGLESLDIRLAYLGLMTEDAVKKQREVAYVPALYRPRDASALTIEDEISRFKETIKSLGSVKAEETKRLDTIHRQRRIIQRLMLYRNP